MEIHSNSPKLYYGFKNYEINKYRNVKYEINKNMNADYEINKSMTE